MMRALALPALLAFTLPAPLLAQETPTRGDLSALTGADVVFLGEIHDNPAHHARQAELVAEIQPVALVFEMLTAEQAAQVTPDLMRDEAALQSALAWNDSGWPDFSMYYPIFAAAPEAAVFGAELPREEARAVPGPRSGRSFWAERGLLWAR